MSLMLHKESELHEHSRLSQGAVCAGYAAPSFGVHCAAMAGMPPGILERTEEVRLSPTTEQTVSSNVSWSPRVSRTCKAPWTGEPQVLDIAAQGRLSCCVAHVPVHTYTFTSVRCICYTRRPSQGSDPDAIIVSD